MAPAHSPCITIELWLNYDTVNFQAQPQVYTCMVSIQQYYIIVGVKNLIIMKCCANIEYSYLEPSLILDTLMIQPLS